MLGVQRWMKKSFPGNSMGVKQKSEFSSPFFLSWFSFVQMPVSHSVSLSSPG